MLCVPYYPRDARRSRHSPEPAFAGCGVWWLRSSLCVSAAGWHRIAGSPVPSLGGTTCPKGFLQPGTLLGCERCRIVRLCRHFFLIFFLEKRSRGTQKLSLLSERAASLCYLTELPRGLSGMRTSLNLEPRATWPSCSKRHWACPDMRAGSLR